MRREFLDGKVFDSIEHAQAELDVWVEHYNHDRPHQILGMIAPFERFKLARTKPVEIVDAPADAPDPAGAMPAERATRVVSRSGTISFCAVRHPVAVWLAGERVEVVCDGGLVHVHHRGVVVATHARKHQPTKQRAGLRRAARGTGPRGQTASSTSPVTRKVDSAGNVSFAGASYCVARKYARLQVQVCVVGQHVEISIDGELIRQHPIRHDRTREHGALANPGGRPAAATPPQHRGEPSAGCQAATGANLSTGYRDLTSAGLSDQVLRRCDRRGGPA